MENSPVSEEDFKEFLLVEFQQCFEHMRHYDNSRIALMKFLMSFYSILPPLIYGTFNIFYHQLTNFFFYLYLFLLVVFLFGFLMLGMLIQNRKYFVRVARQVNTIRRYFWNKRDIISNLPLDSSKPRAHHHESVHLWSIYTILSLNSLVFGAAWFFLSLQKSFLKNVAFGLFLLGVVTGAAFQVWYTFRTLREDEEIEKEEGTEGLL